MPCQIAVYITDLSKEGCIPKALLTPDTAPYIGFSAGGKSQGSVLVSCAQGRYDRGHYISEKQITASLSEGHAVLTIDTQDAPRLFMSAYSISRKEHGLVSVAEYISRDNGRHWQLCDPDISLYRLRFNSAVKSIITEREYNRRLKIK